MQQRRARLSPAAGPDLFATTEAGSRPPPHSVTRRLQRDSRSKRSPQSSPVQRNDCDGAAVVQFFAQRNPTWLLAVRTSPLPRVPTMYRVQYWSVQRNEPPRWTRFASRGSAGSKELSGPFGLRATIPVLSSCL